MELFGLIAVAIVAESIWETIKMIGKRRAVQLGHNRRPADRPPYSTGNRGGSVSTDGDSFPSAIHRHYIDRPLDIQRRKLYARSFQGSEDKQRNQSCSKGKINGRN